MTTSSSRAVHVLGRLFRSIPEAELAKAGDDVADIVDQFDSEAPISSGDALTGSAEGMHGANAEPMVSSHSSLDAQRGRQAEYQSLAHLMGGLSKAVKELTAAMSKPVAPAVKADEPTYMSVVEKSLKKAKAEIFKAETEDKDDDGEDCVGKAERLLQKAAKLLVKAEDDDEDEDKVEKARATIRSLTKALKPLKDAEVAKAAAVEKAEADKLALDVAAKAEADKLVAAKAEDEDEKMEDDEHKKSDVDTRIAALTDQFGLVTKSVKEVMDLVSGASRHGSTPPAFAKAETAAAPVDVDYATRIQEGADHGVLSIEDEMKCRNILSRMSVVKSGASLPGFMDLDTIKAELAVSSNPVREVFSSLLTA